MRVVGVATGLVCLGVLLPGSVSTATVRTGSGERVADPTATTVTGDCWGGPGRMTFTVHARTTADTYKLDVRSRRMVDGSRWNVSMLSEQLPEPEPGVFHRRVRDGGWAATIELGPRRGDGLAYFEAFARERGARHGCLLWLRLGSAEPRATAECGNRDPFTGDERLAVLTAQRLDESTLGLRFDLYEDRRPRTWHIVFSARGDRTRRTVTFNGRTDRRGHLTASVKLRRIDNPRLRVVASRARAPRCAIGLNPSDRL
jgi:hypothetical protein